ncbi:MAG: hypothetical protein AAF791_11215 [Bacteroidota bacterium]
MTETQKKPRFGTVMIVAAIGAVLAGLAAGDEQTGIVAGLVLVTLGASFDAVRTGAATVSGGYLHRESQPVAFWLVVGCWSFAGAFLSFVLLLAAIN